MNATVDLSKTIAPKSDQLNADDLIAGPITITVTRVRGCDESDQPIAVHYDGDNGKPYKPCKSMRRVLVRCWGADGGGYVGRRMTLYRDEGVQFGGIKVGGIRISHLSHIDGEIVIPLTVTRASRKPYPVKPLAAERRDLPPRQEDQRRQDPAPQTQSGAGEATLEQRAEAYEKRIREAPSTVKLNAYRAAAERLNLDLDRSDPERRAELDKLWQDRFDELAERERAGE